MSQSDFEADKGPINRRRSDLSDCVETFCVEIDGAGGPRVAGAPIVRRAQGGFS